MTEKYILDGKRPVPCADILDWGRWFQTAERRVAETFVGDCRVSTVFLGLDHQYGGGLPLLFETMVFGGPLDDEQRRYPTWEEAEAGHREMVELVRAAVPS